MPIVGDRLLQPCDPSGDLPERDQGDRRDKVSLRRHRVADASLAGSDGGGPWAVRVVPRTRHPAEGPALTRVAACFVLRRGRTLVGGAGRKGISRPDTRGCEGLVALLAPGSTRRACGRDNTRTSDGVRLLPLMFSLLALGVAVYGTTISPADSPPPPARETSPSAVRFFVLLSDGVEITDAWSRRVFPWDGDRWVELESLTVPRPEPG
jgi:hypothetical protein